MFRLHMDLPLKMDESICIDAVNKFTTFMENNKEFLTSIGITDINYRLGHDDDRQKSNYMIKNENGHVANKKSRIHLLSDNDDVE